MLGTLLHSCSDRRLGHPGDQGAGRPRRAARSHPLSQHDCESRGTPVGLGRLSPGPRHFGLGRRKTVGPELQYVVVLTQSSLASATMATATTVDSCRYIYPQTASRRLSPAIADAAPRCPSIESSVYGAYCAAERRQSHQLSYSAAVWTYCIAARLRWNRCVCRGGRGPNGIGP